MIDKFIQIATGIYDNNGETDFVLYGLDSDGKVWYLCTSENSWKRITDKRTVNTALTKEDY